VTANYRRSAFGSGYFAVLSADGEPVTCTIHAADMHEALHQVLDAPKRFFALNLGAGVAAGRHAGRE